MREIKFKIWQKKEKKMYGIIDFTPPTEKNYSSKVWIDVDNNTVLLQFTGLKDKNGKECYEGDIIQYKGLNPFKVKWQGEGENDYGYGWNFGRSDFEIIGNIFENKDLIN